MTKTQHAIGAMLVTGAALALSACGGGDTTTITTRASTTKSPPATTSSPTPTGSASPSPDATNDQRLPVVTPAADSPALANFTTEQIAAAMTVAQVAAIDGISDTGLILTTPHTLPDFAAAEHYLTPATKVIFEDLYAKASASTSDPDAVKNLFSYAFFQAPDSGFHPDEPVIITGQDVALNPTVNVDLLGADGTPRMNITGSVDVGFVGTDPAKGGHGIMVISRTFTYAMVPTGDPDQPYAIDGWNGNTNYADTIKPYTGQ